MGKLNYSQIFSKILLWICILHPVHSSSTNKFYPCSLQWEEYSVGDKIPSTAVPAYPPSIYVARSIPDTTLNEEPIIGHFDRQSGLAYFPKAESDSVIELQTFEILLNNYNCSLNWVGSNHELVTKPEFTIPSQDGISNSYIGRGSIEQQPEEEMNLYSNIVVSGSVDPSRQLLLVADTNVTLELDSTEYYVLLSTSEGLKLFLKDFKLADNVYGGPVSMIGMEKIINEGKAEITQSVTHSKMIREKSTMYSAVSWTVASTIGGGFDVGFSFLGAGISGSKFESNSETTETTYSKETIREVTTMKQIVVPPFTSIQACTTLQSLENFTTTWTATAEFSSAGLSAVEVIAQVKKDPTWADLKFIDLDGKKTITTVSGVFSATMALNSNFYVGASGCQELKEFLAARKRKYNRNARNYDWEEEQIEIRKIFEKVRIATYGH